MWIDQTKQVENYNAAGLEYNKWTTPETGNIEANGVFSYEKVQESYRMTDKGSFFMPDATYGKPEKEEKTVLEQLDNQADMSATERKNQMVVLTNTASASDLEELSKDGFDAMDTDSHTILTVTDKIKAVLAKAGVDISIYGDDLSLEQLEAATGSSALAQQLASELALADLPASKANVEEGAAAYAAAEALLPLDDASKEYLLKNNWEPSIHNLYFAAHSSVASTPKQGIDFAGLEKQLEKIITDAGLPINEETKASARWLVEREIPLTKDNLQYLQGLNQLSKDLGEGGQLGSDYVLGRIIEAIAEGKRPMDAQMIDGFSLMDKAQMAMDTISRIEDVDIAYCMKYEMKFTVENFRTAMNYRGEFHGVSVNVELSTEIQFVKAKRQLEETRLAMTVEANYALLKRGVAIDTKPLEQLVEQLKSVEEDYYKNLLNQSGVEANETNISSFAATTQAVAELRYQPAYILTLDSAGEQLGRLYKNGSVLKASMEAALTSYETLWTAPRRDMGDSIQKAFTNVDDILRELGLEAIEPNQRAVRILAHNQTELTAENITAIKNVDSKVQKLFRGLTPAVTMEMIRRGENPLDMDIDSINQMVEDIQSELGNKEEERFSKYLWKLEQNKEITQEERESYIGIYRLIAQVERTDGAALGALLNQGSDITMRNIITAMRSARTSMDYSVDDDFAGVESRAKGPRIDNQIMAAYQNNCVKEVMDLLSPEALEEVESWEDLTPEQLAEQLKEAQSVQTELQEKQYYSELAQEYTSVLEAGDDVYAFLEKYELKNSPRNVLAAARLMENPSNVFEMLFGTEGKSESYKEMIAGLKEEVLERFGEAVKTPKEMAEAQEALAEVAERAMQTMITENETVSVKDLRDLRLMNQQLFLCKETAKEESFLVPVETGNGDVTGISLKIVRGKGTKGLVDIFFRGALMEKVAASFEAKENGISGVIATTDEETRRIFADNLAELTSRLQEEGQEALDIRVAKVENLSMWQFEKKEMSEQGEVSSVQTKRLYHIAESFIQTASALM